MVLEVELITDGTGAIYPDPRRNGFNRFEEDFLELNGYASAIYRRFFVIRSGNKVDQLPIKQIVDHFGWSGNSRYPEVIKRAFEDIKTAGLIADYKLNTNGGRFSKGYIEVEKSSK